MVAKNRLSYPACAGPDAMETVLLALASKGRWGRCNGRTLGRDVREVVPYGALRI